MGFGDSTRYPRTMHDLTKSVSRVNGGVELAAHDIQLI